MLCLFFLLSGTVGPGSNNYYFARIMFGILGLRDMKNAAVVDGPSVWAKMVIKLP